MLNFIIKLKQVVTGFINTFIKNHVNSRLTDLVQFFLPLRVEIDSYITKLIAFKNELLSDINKITHIIKTNEYVIFIVESIKYIDNEYKDKSSNVRIFFNIMSGLLIARIVWLLLDGIYIVTFYELNDRGLLDAFVWFIYFIIIMVVLFVVLRKKNRIKIKNAAVSLFKKIRDWFIKKF